jgi:hypothetical protein
VDAGIFQRGCLLIKFGFQTERGGVFFQVRLDSQNAVFLHYIWQNILTKWGGWVPTPDHFLDPPVNRTTMVLQRMEIIFVHFI